MRNQNTKTSPPENAFRVKVPSAPGVEILDLYPDWVPPVDHPLRAEWWRREHAERLAGIAAVERNVRRRARQRFAWNAVRVVAYVVCTMFLAAACAVGFGLESSGVTHQDKWD